MKISYAAIPEPGQSVRDALILAMCKAHDREQAAQMGEPSPWDIDNPEDEAEFVGDRTAAMAEALDVAIATWMPVPEEYRAKPLTSPHSPIPAGDLVTVPREPTPEMLDAAYAANHFVGHVMHARAYRAMLAASPAHATGAAMREAMDGIRAVAATAMKHRGNIGKETQFLSVIHDRAIAALNGEVRKHPDAALSTPAPEGEAAQPAETVLREIRVEREKQFARHGWSPEHDDQHIHAQLSKAAICYANPWAPYQDDSPPDGWPWASRWWRPEPTYRANLVKAAALLVAEIGRLDRREAKSGGGA